MKSTNLVLAALSAIAFAGNVNADTVDLGGITTGEGLPSIVNINIGVGTVAGLNFDFDWLPENGSWASELTITIEAPGGETMVASSAINSFGPYDLELGGPQNSDPFAFNGSSPVLNGVSTLGMWTITLSESFDDAGNLPDGVFDDGSDIEIKVASAVVPVPAALWLFGSALAGLGVARRRKIA